MVSDETGSPDTRFYIQTCIQPSPIQKKYNFFVWKRNKIIFQQKIQIENKFVVPYFNYAKSIQIFNYFFTFNFYWFGSFFKFLMSSKTFDNFWMGFYDTLDKYFVESFDSKLSIKSSYWIHPINFVLEKIRNTFKNQKSCFLKDERNNFQGVQVPFKKCRMIRGLSLKL